MSLKLTTADKQKLCALLSELAAAVEELLLTGLTTASETTRQTLNVAFQEASRMGLLRLGGTLRAANEELARFTKKQPDFSPSRLSFFLNRSWLLSQAIARAIKKDDDQELDRLMMTPRSRPVEQLDVVTMGVALKVVANNFCAFDFRLRVVNPTADIPVGQRLAWSCVYPLTPGADLPPEGYLHIPNKQKFRAIELTKPNVIRFKNTAISIDAAGSGRLILQDDSTCEPGDGYSDWQQFFQWSPETALARIKEHRPGPFDLEIEMQEEVVLDEWQVAEQEPAKDASTAIFPIKYKTAQLKASVTANREGETVRQALQKFRKAKSRPPIYGLMHYEKGNLILQPLSVLDTAGPQHLMLKGEKFDRAQILKLMKF